jgi:Zn-dependent protease with chaperone function
MNISDIRTRGEKILFPIAMVFSGLFWLVLLFGLVVGMIPRSTEQSASQVIVESPEPCIYIHEDYYYFMTQEQAVEHPDKITCLPKEEVPPEIYSNAVEKLAAAISASAPPIDPKAAAGRFFSVILFYIFLIFSFIYISTALAMAMIRLNGVRLSKTQYPAFYKIYEEAAKKLGLQKIPNAYIIHTGGDLNAFAIKITRKKMVVFYADLIENLVEGQKFDELQAVAAHELTHVFLKHIHYWLFLMPFRILPFLTPLLSRMRETSADRGALMVTENHAVVSQALVKLATGKFVAQHIDVDITPNPIQKK